MSAERAPAHWELVLSLALVDGPSERLAREASARALSYLATHLGSVAVCETSSGSRYRIASSDGDWIFTAQNIPNVSSCALHRTGPWVIAPPPGLVVGHRLQLIAPRTLPIDDPTRVPGGGKLTSTLVRLTLYGAYAGSTVAETTTMTASVQQCLVSRNEAGRDR